MAHNLIKMPFAWIGLQKQEDTCNAGISDDDFDCRRKDWSWLDRSEYTYPEWHNWRQYEPDAGNLCGDFYGGNSDGNWFGFNCDSMVPGYLCEKGKT